MKTDKIIDELLAKSAVCAGENFTQSLFEKIEAEKILDERADEFLKSRPVCAGENFTRDVMGKIRAGKRIKIFGYISSSVAAAACAVLSFTVFMEKPDAAMQIAFQMQELENAALSLSEYEDHFDSYNPNFCDYDFNLYAMQ